MQMSDEHMNGQKPPHVYTAIAEVMGDLAKVGIGKNNRNTQQNYKFRGIDDVYNALAPLLARARLLILPRVLSRSVVERESRNGGVLFYVVVDVEFDLVSGTDGSKHTVRVVGEAMDSGDKATNKAMSAAYKYACMEAFCIPTEGDNDADGTTHEPTSKPGVTVVDPRGENRKPQDAALVAKYVERFKAAADNPDDFAAAADVFAIHNEVSSNHDLYIAIGDALGSKYKNAVRKFVEMAKKRAA
jgi:hypothetical protein